MVGAAEEVVPKYFDEHKNQPECKPDVIVVDPPRKGCDQVLLDTIVKMNPERIVYVSCDSATLARDLKWLEEHGYKLKGSNTMRHVWSDSACGDGGMA